MTAQEASEILKSGAAVTGIGFSDDVASLIVSLSQGLPHYTHSLGLNSTRAAVDEGAWTVLDKHVEAATKEAIAASQQSLIRAYHSATSSPRPDNLFRQVLLACALAKTDQLGYFAAADVRDPMSRIMKTPYDIPSYSQHLKQFCEQERGSVLQRTGGERKTRFRFSNPLFQPFVVMNGLSAGHIDKDDVRGLFRIGPGHSPT